MSERQKIIAWIVRLLRTEWIYCGCGPVERGSKQDEQVAMIEEGKGNPQKRPSGAEAGKQAGALVRPAVRSYTKAFPELGFLLVFDGGVIFRTVGVVSALKNGADAKWCGRRRGAREGREGDSLSLARMRRLLSEEDLLSWDSRTERNLSLYIADKSSRGPFQLLSIRGMY